MLKQKGAGRANVLVAGGAGFVGSNLCEFLLERYNVICVDNFFSSTEQNIDTLLSNPHFEFIRHDITQPLDFKNFSTLERFNVAFTGIQHIYHLACPSSPRAFLKSPLEVMMASSVGVKNMLDVALSYRARFVYLSDSLVYGVLNEERPSETSWGVVEQADPLRTYIESKRYAEVLVETYQRLYNLETFIVRLSTAYGPNMHMEDGRLIPEMIAHALQNQVLTIPKDIGAGSYLYVSDAVDALEKIMLSENAGGIFNLGHGAGYSLSEVAEKITALTNSHEKFVLGESPPSETDPLQQAWRRQSGLTNIEKIKLELGWFPVVLLDEGLEKTIDYMKSLRKVRTH